MPNPKQQNRKPLSATVSINRFCDFRTYEKQNGPKILTATKTTKDNPESSAHENTWLIKPSDNSYAAQLECYAFYLHQIFMPTQNIQPKCYHTKAGRTDYVAIKFAENAIPLNQHLNKEKTKLGTLDWRSLTYIHVLAIVIGDIDRRLPNVLYDETSKQCVSIDFNLAFYLVMNSAKTMRRCEFDFDPENQQPWGFAIHYEDFLLPTLNKHFTAGNLLFQSIAMHTGATLTELQIIMKKNNVQKHIFDAITKLLIMPDFMLRLETEAMPPQQDNRPYLLLKHNINKLLATMLQCPEFREYLSETTRDKAYLDTICRDLSTEHIARHRNFRHHEKTLLQKETKNQLKENMRILLRLCTQAKIISNRTIIEQLAIIEKATDYSDIHPALITLRLTRALTAPSQNYKTIAAISSIMYKLPKSILETIIYDYQSLTTTLRIIQPKYRLSLLVKIAAGNNLSLFISTINQVTTITELCFRGNHFSKTAVCILLNTIFDMPQIPDEEKIAAISALGEKIPKDYPHDISLAFYDQDRTEIRYKITKLLSRYFAADPNGKWPTFMPKDKLTLQRPGLAPLKLKNACTLTKHLPHKQQIPYIITIIDTYLWDEKTFFHEILPILNSIKNVAKKLPLYRQIGRQLMYTNSAQLSTDQLNDPEIQRIQLYYELAMLEIDLSQLKSFSSNTLIAVTFLQCSNKFCVLQNTIREPQQFEQIKAVKKVCEDFERLILTPIAEYNSRRHNRAFFSHKQEMPEHLPTIPNPTC